MNFTFSKRAKMISMALIIIGLAMAIIGAIGDHTEQHQHTWAAFFANGIFFFFISLGTLFFFALNYITETAWTVLIKRVYEGVMGFLPIGALVVVICLLAGTFGLNHLWGWMDHRVNMVSDLDHYDPHLRALNLYLNLPFFWVRAIVMLTVFVLFARWFRTQSLKMDHETGESLLRLHWANYRRGVIFMVLFAFFSTLLAWDWIMSIDVHWHSALFGWYVFSGMWISAMITAVIITLYLKGKGYLPQVNGSHIQDMGKWVFAVSFLWSYLYFAQFLLYWYANIPEEVIYFQQRINDYPGLMWGMYFVNFALPMVLLMSRDSKRSSKYLIGVCALIFLGHWLDVQQMILPGTLGDHFHHIGTLEIGFLLGFLGLFIRTVFSTLAKAPLTVVHHPFLEESVHHHI